MFQRPKPAKATPPSYYFNCVRCQRPILVEPNLCGSKLDCLCGAANTVPLLIQLKRADSQVLDNSVGANPQTSPAPYQGLVHCPFCSRPMEPGRILGDRYRLKWLQADIPLLGVWAVGGVGIGHGGPLTFIRPYISGWRCIPCGKIISDERA